MVNDPPETEEGGPRLDPSRELATIHSICEKHFQEILNLSKSRVRKTVSSLSTETDGNIFTANTEKIGYCNGLFNETARSSSGQHHFLVKEIKILLTSYFLSYQKLFIAFTTH